MCKEMFLYTLVLKEWAVWNWMLRKISENQLYSHTSPHYGRAAPSATQNFPDCSIKTCPSQQERLFYKNMSIATRETKLKLQIPQTRNFLCVNICWGQHWTSRLCCCPQAQSALCYETKWCCHNFTIYDLSPPPPTHTHKVEHT